jgi:adenylate cyclase
MLQYDHCGVDVTCAACGFDAPAEFAFCPKCGTRLAPAPPEPPSDRRPVSVLFADLVGFTALGEVLDPEDIRALQSELFDAMSGTIERLDGFVEKFVGDAVMAVFGAPVAHDEDPERAVLAAMRLHERAAELDERWRQRLQRPLALHVGIHTGPVVAGHFKSQRESAYAVTGDTVNAAARLQNAAGAGETLVSEATWALTRHAFRFESVGALPLKGKAQPMVAYRLLGVAGAPAAARGLHAHGLAAPMVGREPDLRLLHSAFDAMRAGRTQLVSIVADAGTGKSRLLAEFLERLRSEGAMGGVAVRNAACSSLGERTYGVPAALLRDAYGLAAQDPPGVARRKVAVALGALGADEHETQQLSSFLGYVLGLEADDAAAPHLDPEQLKRQIFRAVQAIIERRLQLGALMLIVEDLHWADAASIELLRFLLDRLHDRPFMLLVTHRPAPRLADLAGEATSHTLLRLEPLSPRDSAALIEALFGTTRRVLPEELRLRMVEQSGGNPLFLEEMVRALIAEGVLVHDGDAWTCHPRVAAVPVPLTIHGLLLGRIDRLPAAARQLLQEASVIGPVFGETLLCEVAADPRSVPARLETLAAAGMISLAPAGAAGGEPADRRHRFRHGLFQEVSYQNLLASRRTELHTRIGEAIERQCGGAPRHLEELQALAHHFRLSSDKPRGVHYLVAAGDRARAVYSNADAMQAYELALETLDAAGGDEGRRLAIDERLADVLAPAGHVAAARRHLDSARAGHASSGDAMALARVLRKIAALHWQAGERAEAASCLASGLSLVDGAPPSIEPARLYQAMGELAFRSGDNTRALEWTQRALDHAQALDSSIDAPPDDMRGDIAAAVAFSLNTQGAALARMNRLEEAVTQLERSVAVARDADLPQAECRALSNLGVLYSGHDPQRAIEACERGLETARRIGDMGLQSRLCANLAVAYCTLTNRCDERGIGAAHAAIQIDRSTGQLDHLAVSLVVLAQICQCHGESARALGHYREALVLAEKTAEPQLLFPCYDGLATLYLDLDDADQAEHYMALARQTCERAGLDPDALIVLPFLA